MDISQAWVPLVMAFMAGLFTLLGGSVLFFVKDLKKSYLQFSMGLSAGMMIYISFVEILGNAIKTTGFFAANIAFFGGIILVMVVDFLVPHEYIEEHIEKKGYDKKTMKAGLLIAFGIGIHNFPEGMAVFMSSMVNLHLGITIAMAIALHNIPEGIAVAMPVYYATKSKKKALKYAFLSGIAEPIGALVAFALLLPFLNPTVLALCLASVAGIMIFISFDELLPLSYEGSGSHVAIIGIILGMFIMALSLQLF